jgi:ABC-type transport system involved in multi-copper enzyme maturation permease subunit
MSPAIVIKTFRDTRGLALLTTAGVIVFEILLVRGIRELPQGFKVELLNLEIIKRVARLLVGADLLENFTATGVMTVGFVHPLVLALNWTLLLTICTRITTAEIERGTADLLLTLPVSRTRIYFSSSLVWLLYGVPMSLAPLLGVAVGTRVFPLWEPVDLGRLALLCVNLYALYLAVGGVAIMVGSLVSGRGLAVGIALTVLLASVLINFLEQLWPAIEKVAFLGLLHHYRPLLIVRNGEIPGSNLLTLGGVFVISWLVGWTCFSRRDIPAA